MAFGLPVDLPPLTSKRSALYDEVEQQLEFLHDRENSDKLEDFRFYLAGLLLERSKWNSRTIRDADLREFVATARELVNEIKAANHKAPIDGRT